MKGTCQTCKEVLEGDNMKELEDLFSSHIVEHKIEEGFRKSFTLKLEEGGKNEKV